MNPRHLATLLGLSLPLLAASPASVTVTAVPGPSTIMGVMPVSPAAPANTVFYDYTVVDGQGITDEIPVGVTLVQQVGDWTSFRLAFHPAGSLIGATMPDPVLVTPAFTWATALIRLDVPPMTLADPGVAETRTLNINLQPEDRTPSNLGGLHNNFKTIHIRFNIVPATQDTFSYMTDSSGNLLLDCAGQAVTSSGSMDGRFAIVANGRKIEVATNPGQFYYNILWTNRTGSPQVVDVAFDRVNGVPKGANSIHAYAFPPAFSGVSAENFQAVNEAIPGGSGDAIQGVTVPAGWTLWANTHMEWAGLGGALPAGIATTCGTANQVLRVTGTLSGGVDRVSTSGAKGYRK